jgi:tetratricopeptide (TPR) repeat protein
MSGPSAGWSAGFVAATAVAGMFLLSTCQGKPSPVEAQVVLKRDPAGVTDVELELILNKIREGDLLWLKSEPDRARRAWDEARRLGAGLWPIHEGLADSFLRAKLHEEAVREYRIAARFVSERHAAMRQEIAIKIAESLAAWGRPLEALHSYLEANQPDRLEARILDQALKVRDSSVAERAIADRASIFDPRVYRVLSSFYVRLGRQADAAEAAARFAISVAPWDESLNRRAIEDLRAAGRFDLAIEVCRAWVRSTPEAVAVYQLMGDLLREAGREREAIVAYTSVVDLRPGDAQAHRWLGDLFKRLHRLDDAVAQYEAAKKARPEDATTWMTLASLYEEKGDTTKSEETLVEATKRSGAGGEIRSRLVAFYQDRLTRLKAAGKGDEVRALRRRLADLDVEEAGIYDLKVIMTWDVLSDVDLDIIEPSGEHVEHGHPRSKAGGRYYVDNTRGFGPETYTLAKAAPGTYRIGAHLHGNVRSTVRFVVILYEDTPREERMEETLILDRSSAPKLIKDLIIPRR